MSDNIKPQRETESTTDDASRKTNSVVDTWGDWVDNLSEDELDFLEQQDAEDEEKYGPVFLREDDPEAYDAAEASPDSPELTRILNADYDELVRINEEYEARRRARESNETGSADDAGVSG